MINALVVDDERLVRQGLQSLTNWQAFDISFVGEAKDGVQALRFLAEQEVDVMFVDITMPNMNGFELIKHVQERHPHVNFVILTCHHEFDYVQEALQLGAIDYIVKTLLNRDNVEETAKRIVSRLKRELKRKQDVPTLYPGGIYLYYYTSHSAYLPEHAHSLQAEGKKLDPHWFRLHPGYSIEKLDNVVQYVDVVVVKLSASKRMTTEAVEHWLMEQGERLLFYSGDGDHYLHLTDAQLSHWMQQLSASSKEQEQRFFHDTETYRWLLYPQEWARWVEQVLQLKPSPAYMQQLCDYFYRQVLLTMAISHAEYGGKQLDQPQALTWKCTERWLQQFSIFLRSKMGDLSFSHEVMLCMIKAIRYMHEQISLELNQNELAYQVGMSRSYFSQCFKRFFGVSFGDVLRTLRLNAAKQLLITTQLTISEIANRVGFVDHKYFSRAFKAQLGVYPTEYRSIHAEELK